jgi:hypothetical protein
MNRRSIPVPLAYRPENAAKAIGVSPRTFADWLKSDIPPPSIRRGGAVLVPIRELRNWLTNQLQGNPTDAGQTNEGEP